MKAGLLPLGVATAPVERQARYIVPVEACSGFCRDDLFLAHVTKIRFDGIMRRMKFIHTGTIGAFACISALIGAIGCGEDTASTSTGATTTATSSSAAVGGAAGTGNGASSSDASSTTAAAGGSSTTGGGMGGMTASSGTDMGAGASTSSGMGMMAAPDFSIKDVNPSSASLGNDISPKDYQGQATAWFFGHST
ncbi:MAG: hypothetical protein VB934_09265 [Polyangiaceae bacterium]